MFNVCAELENHFAKSQTMPETKSSHHFVPISCRKITHKLTNKDEEFLQFDFENSSTEEIDIKNTKCFLYVSCIYDTFSWVGIVHSILQGWNPPFSEGLNPPPPLSGCTPSFWEPSKLVYVNCMKHQNEGVTFRTILSQLRISLPLLLILSGSILYPLLTLWLHIAFNVFHEFYLYIYINIYLIMQNHKKGRITYQLRKPTKCLISGSI